MFSWRQFMPLNWPDSDSDFAQVRVSVRVPDPTQSQSQISLKKPGQENTALLTTDAGIAFLCQNFSKHLLGGCDKTKVEMGGYTNL